MNSFPHSESQKNIPGYESFWFANSATISPLSITNQILSSAPSMGGAVFYEGYSTDKRLEVNVEPKLSDQGTIYEISIKGVMPKHKSDVIQLFEELLNLYFCVIVRDRNGKYIWLGDVSSNGLNFIYEQTDAGYNFEFSGVQIFTPPFFTGTIPV